MSIVVLNDELVDRDLGEEMRRVTQVDLGGAQHLGHPPEPGDHRHFALARGGEAALEQRLDRAGHQVEVGVGIGLERPDDLEVEQLALDPRREHVAVERARERELVARDPGEPVACVVEPGGVPGERGLRDHLQLAVVGVDAEAGRELRAALEPAVEVAVGQLAEALVGALGPRRGREPGGEGGEQERADERGAHGQDPPYDLGTISLTSDIGSPTRSGPAAR